MVTWQYRVWHVVEVNRRGEIISLVSTYTSRAAALGSARFWNSFLPDRMNFCPNRGDGFIRFVVLNPTEYLSRPTVEEVAAGLRPPGREDV